MTQFAPCTAPAPDGILSIEEVGARMRVRPRVVRAWMTAGPTDKRLGYVAPASGEPFTTEVMLAAWLTANMVNAARYPARTNQLEQDVIARVSVVLEELLRRHRIRVWVDRRHRLRIGQAPPREAAHE